MFFFCKRTDYIKKGKMVHTKYTYKDGKKFGPYYYETKRVDGKVITTYLGTELPVREQNNSKKYFLALFALLTIAIFSFIFYNFYALTGHASLDLKTDYVFGEAIEGIFTLNLKSGEFIPVDSNLIVSYGDNTQTLALSSLISYNLQEGDYYAEDTSVSGHGLGYGSVGTANIYPEISFQLKIVEEDVSDSLSDSSSSDSSSDSASDSSSDSSSSDSSSDSASDSSSDSSSSDSGGITGSVIEDDSVIFGTVSGSNDFKKSLSDGQTAEIIPGSVVYNDTIISDDSISFELVNGEVVVSSKYSVVLEGYGKEYLGDYSDEISIDLSQFGLIADLEAPFSIELVYQDVSIVSSSEDISVVGSVNESNASLTPEIAVLEINESEVNVNLTQFDAVIGQPVKWNKRVSFDLNSSVNLFVQIPANAQDVIIDKINATEYAEENDLTLEEVISQDSSEISNEIEINEPNDSNIDSESILLENESSSQTNSESISDSSDSISSDSNEPVAEMTIGVTGNIVSGHVTADISLAKESKFFKKVKSLFGITGRVISSEIISEVQELSINLSENEFGVDLEYTTEAPTATEEDFGFSKKVYVSGPEDVHYENVLIFTSISDSLEITDYSTINIEWIENLSHVISIYNASDTNGDGNYDYISWIAPHLSNQTFNLILVVKAKHLDSNYTVISDVYDEVVALDGNWTNEINDTQIVRVTFEQKLTSVNDITLFANVTQGIPIIKVYEKSGNDTLAIFENINNSVLQSIYLTNLSGEQKTFDLQIIGGSVIFDYIVDPVINLIGGPVTDIDMTPLGNETFAIVYVNISRATVQFSVLNTNGTTFTAPVNVFQGVNSNLSRVSITAINSTAVFIGIINNSIDYRLLYSKTGALLAGPFTGDAALGANNWDVSVTALGLNNIVAYCYSDFTEGDHDMRIFNNNLSIGSPSAPALALELDTNGAMLPLSDIQDHLECSAINSSDVFAFEYDSTSDDDATYHIISINQTSSSFPYNKSFNERVVDTDIDAAVGNFGQVATATLNGNSSVMVWYNSTAIRYAIRSWNNVALKAATDLSKKSGTFSRVAVASVDNQSGRDFFVTAWYNQSSAQLLGAAFDDVGNIVTNHFVIDTAFNPINATALFDIVGEEAGTGLSLCSGKWAIAYTNSTNSTVIKTYNLAGQTWNGICGGNSGIDDSTVPVVLLKDPANNSVTTGSVVTFKADFTDNLNVSSALLHIYNTSNGVADKLIGTNLTNLGNSSISANISYALNYTGIFYWNFLAYDNTGNKAFNITNFSLTYSASITNVVPYNLTQLVLNTSLSGSLNMSIENLTLSMNISDPNGDKMNVTIYWYNGTNLAFVEHNKSNYANGTIMSGFLLHTNTTKGHNWSVGVIITDGVGNSTQINSSVLLIQNTPPSLLTFNLPQNGNITTDRTPYFEFTSEDIDGDSYVAGFNVTPIVRSPPCSDPSYEGTEADVQYFDGNGDSTFSLLHELKCLIDRGYTYNVSVRLNDSSLSNINSNSGWISFRNLSVQAYLSITATTSQVNFSGINFNEWNDTSDDKPLPLVLRNDGNAYTNITLASNDLWSSVVNPSKYYQFKVDNVTASGENASFRASNSLVVYTNFDISDIAVLCVAELNYTDSRDSVEIDINVTVPLDEPPGTRGSVITFLGELGE